ncbi:leukotriene B4 receptor 1-like [Bufo gargarizans]|uniref:leukotriene B4 receptor 1-like n=1 Tax=Bufo gargarizans TaxID=30331 RepID=UPI001CF42C32|nr:leukotriene B4 receptor 1-like [Bufo gargarizans]XP_044150799.1 leukotriene B4 receptor 1-like [Bufo gargarizans]
MMTKNYTVTEQMTALHITAAISTAFTNSSSDTSKSSSGLGIAILSIALIIGFPGNTFVIWTILTRMKKRTVTCILILHLAIADIFVLLTAPLFLHLLSTGMWVFGEVICKMCRYISCLSMYTSIFLITFMGMDRFLAVSRPYVSQKIRTKVTARIIVLALWVIASLLSIPTLIYFTVKTSNGVPLCIAEHPPVNGGFQPIVFQYMFETMMGFVIPFTIIVSCYAYIGLRLRTVKFQSKHKTSRLVIMIIVIFALFWTPYHVVNMIQVSGELYSSEKLRVAVKSAKPNAIALAFLSSSINPVLYVFAGGNFIRTAGLGFMAKLFEATGSEASSLRKVSQVLSQKSRKQSTEQGKLNQTVEE